MGFYNQKYAFSHPNYDVWKQGDQFGTNFLYISMIMHHSKESKVKKAQYKQILFQV